MYRMHSRQVKSVESRGIGAEVILLDTHGGKYFSLNDTGKLVWELLALGLSDQSICARVAAKYDISVELASVDCGELISALVASGLATPES